MSCHLHSKLGHKNFLVSFSFSHSVKIVFYLYKPFESKNIFQRFHKYRPGGESTWTQQVAWLAAYWWKPRWFSNWNTQILSALTSGSPSLPLQSCGRSCRLLLSCHRGCQAPSAAPAFLRLPINSNQEKAMYSYASLENNSFTAGDTLQKLCYICRDILPSEVRTLSMLCGEAADWGYSDPSIIGHLDTKTHMWKCSNIQQLRIISFWCACVLGHLRDDCVGGDDVLHLLGPGVHEAEPSAPQRDEGAVFDLELVTVGVDLLSHLQHCGQTHGQSK